MDAILDGSQPGSVSVLEEELLKLEDQREYAHYSSVIQALVLLRAAVPSLAATRITLIGVSINSAHMVPELSPALAKKLPEILRFVLHELS